MSEETGAETGPLPWRLRLIAEILDVSVERLLSDDAAPGDRVGPQACLRLWSRIRTEAGRARALDCLRRIAEDERR